MIGPTLAPAGGVVRPPISFGVILAGQSDNHRSCARGLRSGNRPCRGRRPTPTCGREDGEAVDNRLYREAVAIMQPNVV